VIGAAVPDVSQESRQRLLLQRICLPLLAFAYPIIVAHRGFIYDDTYILMRYAQHLAHGAWQFNTALPTDNAATSPLYVALLAAGAAIGISPVIWSVIIYTAAWGFGGIMLARVLDSEGHTRAAWIACGLYSVSPLLTNVRGMETSVYLLLILAAIRCLQRQQWIALGCVLGLVTLARADAALMVAAMIGWLIIRRPHRDAVAAIIPCTVIAAGGACALWAMTGTLFPSTLAAKLAQRDSGIFGSPWAFLRMLHVYGVVGGDGGGTVMWANILGLLGVVLILLAVFGTAAARRDVAVPWLAVAAAIVLIEYGVVFRLPPYYWHYGPFTLWVIAAAAVALDQLFRRAHHVPVLAVITAAAAASVLSAGCHLQGFLDAHSHYRQVAEWIDRDSRAAHPTVAVGEIGIIGYYGRSTIVDYMGLLDARAVEPVRHNDFTWWLTQHPDYFVTAPVFALDDPVQSLPEFRHEYHLAARLGPMIVYRRA
jgi:hypothetical protein